MKLLFSLLLLLPAVVFCQQKNVQADTLRNEFGDSAATQILAEKYNAAHQLMVSFTQGKTAELNNFWIYLLSELHYRTDKPNMASLKPAKAGSAIAFAKYGEGYETAAKSITVNVNCNKNGSNLQGATITGDDDLLSELFVKYFGGSLKTGAKGGANIAYTVTDEVKLSPGKIVISAQPHGSNHQ